MANDIFEQVYLIIVMIIVGAVVAILGAYLQSLPIVLFGIGLAGAIPIFGLVLSLIESL